MPRASSRTSGCQPIWKSLSVKSDVNSNSSAKLVETSTVKRRCGLISGKDNRHGRAGAPTAAVKADFGVSDADEAYRQMLGCLVQDITDDFRTHYVTRRVPERATPARRRLNSHGHGPHDVITSTRSSKLTMLSLLTSVDPSPVNFGKTRVALPRAVRGDSD